MTDARQRGRTRIAVLASGGGSNLGALLAHLDALGEARAGDVVLVASDRPEAGALERARARGIATALLRTKANPGGAVLHELLREHRIDLVVLAGFLRLVPPEVVRDWPGRIVNVHPGPLPRFGGPGMHGVHVHEAVLASGATESAATVHLVDEAYDTGPVIASEPVPVLPGDTPQSLAARVLAAEHHLLPQVVQALASKRMPIALLSVSDKTGLVPFAQALASRGWELVSTGGTARALRDAGLTVREVADLTGFPEMLDGRVKTLHPMVHGGLLARRDLPEHMAALAEHHIAPIDLVVVNLYPFRETVARGGATPEEIVEQIDIGGPSMLRSAAKNFESVTVVVDPADYDRVVAALDAGGDAHLRRDLAGKVYAHTSAYDAAIGEWFAHQRGERFPERLNLAFQRKQPLRYGENPDQGAAFYVEGTRAGLAGLTQRGGKELSFNNLLDLEGALLAIEPFGGQPACAIIKHTTPCGLAIGTTALEAYQKALAGDPVSAFGGIVAFSIPVDDAAAEAVSSLFVECIVAPAFSEGAVEILGRKKNLRVLEGKAGWPAGALDYKRVRGGILVQERSGGEIGDGDWKVVTRRSPTDAERQDLLFAWRAVASVKSNAIVLARGGMTIGIGAGQMSRVDASFLAVHKARQQGHETAGAALGSDAFFPFRDGVDQAAEAGVRAIVQPGGSVRDAEVIAAADEHGIAMVFTGHRQFRH